MSKRAAAVLLLLTAVAMFFTICYRVLLTPSWNFNGARLMPSFAIAHGIDYYMLPHEGPLYCSVYGPLISLVYLPATLFPSPNSAVLTGSAITAILTFSAAAFMVLAPFRDHRRASDVLAFLTAGFLLCYLEPLKYACFNIHADGPGLACGGVACAALYFSRQSRFALPVSACFAVLAIFCKQIFLPVPLALLVCVLASDGRRQATHYLLWVVAVGAVAGGVAMAAMGPARLYHCLIWVPGHQPPNDASALVSIIQAMRNFIRLSLMVVIPLVGFGIYFLAGMARIGRSELCALAAKRFSPALLVGIALLPSAMAGRAKAGGDINSFSLPLFFLACGLAVMLADMARDVNPVSARVAICVLVAVLAPMAISESPLMLNLPTVIKELPQAGQNTAFEYLRKHPGGAYFPWFPISHLYAEHRFTHYAFGIADRLMADEPVSMADFRAYMPANPEIIGFASDGMPDIYGHDLMKYLPEYRYKVSDPALPGWLVFAKSERQ
jgi:hypothetical protein